MQNYPLVRDPINIPITRTGNNAHRSLLYKYKASLHDVSEKLVEANNPF